MSNHLINETSPYLLQHASNPVDWYPWGPEALEKARREQKMLVISIGYSACHWCHVMEHESFEDQEVAEIMNRYFVSVKVDREERPDLDQFYMNAAYVVSGRGGWPLNVVALPDQKPVFAGTYFPKSNWIQVLQYFSDLYRKNREGLVNQAAEIMQELGGFRKFTAQGSAPDRDPRILEEIFGTLKGQLDFEEGGTRGTPKFPMPSNLSFLLKYSFLSGDSKTRDYVTHSLKKIAMGGIFDHVGGGFCRYSVDSSWRIPHFEKMLYDNAQLVTLYSDAFRWTGDPWFREVVMETAEFIRRELTTPEGLFCSSLDADSDGEEGAFYSWTAADIRLASGTGFEWIMSHFGVTEEGNWENGKNVLYVAGEPETGVRKKILSEIREKLFRQREKRPRPATDYKILTAWNALMIKGYVSAYRAFGHPGYLDAAQNAATFFADRVDAGNGRIQRTYTRGIAAIPGFLDDYAFLVSAFLDLYETSFEPRWLLLSERLSKLVLYSFTDPGSGLFRFASGEPGELTERVIETSDNVIPSSNSVMASALSRLGFITGKESYTLKSISLLNTMYPSILLNPGFHSNWCMLLADFLVPPAEVAVTGEGFTDILKELRRHFLPGTVFYGGNTGLYPETLKGKLHTGKTQIYVCRDKSCLSPVESVAAALPLILGTRAQK